MYYNANGGIGCNDRFTVKLREKQADGSYRQVDDFPPMLKLVERMRKMPECKALMARMDLIYQLYPIIKTMVECGRVPDLSQYEMMKEYKHYDELAPIVCNHTLTDHKGVLDIGFAHIKGGVTSAGFTNYGWHEQTHVERLSSQEAVTFSTKEIILQNIATSQAARNASDYMLFSAGAHQRERGYEPDKWDWRTLVVGEKIWGGMPGQGKFYTTAAAVKDSGMNQKAMWKSVQVGPDSQYPPRDKVQEYVVTRETRVPYGKAEANTEHGEGGAEQFFVTNYKHRLQKKGSEQSLT